MSLHSGSGSPVICAQRYQTVPTAVISHAEQHDCNLSDRELKVLLNFFQSGAKRLEVSETLAQHAIEIVKAGAERIFFGGAPMAYLEAPPNRENLPGYTTPPKGEYRRPSESLKVQPRMAVNPLQDAWQFIRIQLSENREPLPSGFRPINVKRYGVVRMQRSMRDLDWFLRYLTYAIAAGDHSIVTVNVRGLRGVIPEDVTEATVVALKDMKWKAVSYFKTDADAIELIEDAFNNLIDEYIVQKPPTLVREGVSNDQQGLQLPESYALSAPSRPKFVMKPNLSATEKEATIKAVYRQVFERDITQEYGVALTDLESKFKQGIFSTKEFVRQLGRSRLYRRFCYEPFVISRVIELAVRHFLGRGLSSIEEFQSYFEVISQRGLTALIDTLVDSAEYSDYFGEETVPYLRGLGQEAQECRNWGAQHELFKYSASTHKVPQFITLFGDSQHPLPNQHPYGTGHDPLETQFGVVFPKAAWKHLDRPAPFAKDHRRILIHADANNGSSPLEIWGKTPGTSHHRVLKLSNSVHVNGNHNINVKHNGGANAIIEGVYRQLFGREIYPEQRSTMAETKLKSGELTVRGFVQQVAKSRLFRQLYWETQYVTKAIEAIHRRLLGRPTYGRQEINQYYDICAKQGFYTLVDTLIDSREYRATFGEDTVPYERYVTPRGFEMRIRSRAGSLTMMHEQAGNPKDGERVYQGKWMKSALREHYRQTFFQQIEAEKLGTMNQLKEYLDESKTNVLELEESSNVETVEEANTTA
jgi:phycobilisome core-membrane linker protein